jgi:hypothetical protein
MRPCGLTAMSHCGSRFARLASTAVLGHACGLRFGLFCRGKTIPPLRPPACPAPPLACSRRANLASKHTHEYGSISSGWPPNQPASRIAKLFGKSGGVWGGPSCAIGCACCEHGAWKTFAPSKLAAAPSLTLTDSVNQKSAMPPHSRGGHQTQTLEMNTWPTIKRQHTRQSNSSA